MLTQTRWLLATSLALVLGACGSHVESAGAASGNGSAAPATLADCGQRAQIYGSVTRAAGVYAVSAQELVIWQETRHGPNGPRPVSEFRNLPPAELVGVCFVDGSFPGFPRGPGGASKPPYDRLVLLVKADGSSVVDSVGYQSNIPVVKPGP